MIRLEEYDLARPDPSRALPTDEVWFLVRDGNHVLGEVRLGADAAGDIEHLGSPTSLDAVIRNQLSYEIVADRMARDDVENDSARPRAASITVIVCTRDRSELLAGCLDRLTALDPAAGGIVVVDNGSRDDSTRRVVEAAGVDYVREPVAGLNRARNAGWRHARTDLVAYVDDDARADRHLAAGLASGFFDATVGAVTGLVIAHELSTSAQVEFERGGGMRKGFRTMVFAPGSVGVQAFRLGVGTNMAFRRTVLDQLGGFDPSIGVGTPSRGGGDLDALLRVLDAGFDVVYEPDAFVRHIHRRTWPELIAQHRDNGTAYATLLRRMGGTDRERAARSELVRWHVRRHVIGPVRALLRGQSTERRLLVAEALGSRT